MLTGEQLGVLADFVHLNATVDDVCRSLEGVFTFNFGSMIRRAECHFRVPEPGVLVRRDDVLVAMQQRCSGIITETSVMYWATMILLNEAFQIDANDEEFIAEALNDLSFNWPNQGAAVKGRA